MRAFLFYIDDWLSSLRIKQMDAHEEVAYLHLLLAAAQAEDCGLPAEEKQLSMLSGLGPQWFKPTKEKDKRIDGMTSGAKVLACFFPRGGRIYNDRLLKEWQHQKDVNESRRASGRLGGRPRKPNGYLEDNQTVSVEKPNGIASDNHTAKQTKTNDVCVSVSSVPKTENPNRFRDWIAPWKRNSNPNRTLAMWISRVAHEREPDAFAARDRYLQSDEVSRGVIMDPCKFIEEQADSEWSGKWPPKKAKDNSGQYPEMDESWKH